MPTITPTLMPSTHEPIAHDIDYLAKVAHLVFEFLHAPSVLADALRQYLLYASSVLADALGQDTFR